MSTFQPEKLGLTPEAPAAPESAPVAPESLLNPEAGAPSPEAAELAAASVYGPAALSAQPQAAPAATAATPETHPTELGAPLTDQAVVDKAKADLRSSASLSEVEAGIAALRAYHRNRNQAS